MHSCAYTITVEVEWDDGKARDNLRKHGIGFAEAASVLYDTLSGTQTDERAGETRYIAVGSDEKGRILVIVYVWRGNKARLISARLATKSEIRKYRGGP